MHFLFSAIVNTSIPNRKRKKVITLGQIMMPSYYEKETEPSGNHALPQRRDKNIREIEKSIAKKLDYIYALPWICALCMN